MSSLFHSFVYKPLYNVFIGLSNLFPFLDAGLLIVLFTVVVKIALLPLAKRAFLAQEKMKALAPELERIREKYQDDRETQARELMKVYQTAGASPFSGIGLVLIQLPVIFALYFILVQSGLPHIKTELLYSFIPLPHPISMEFLGLFSVAQKSLILALLAGITTYIQVMISSRSVSSVGTQGDLARVMQMQMKFVLPIVATAVSYSISGVVGLYWTVSNITTIIQEHYFRTRLKKE